MNAIAVWALMGGIGSGIGNGVFAKGGSVGVNAIAVWALLVRTAVGAAIWVGVLFVRTAVALGVGVSVNTAWGEGLLMRTAAITTPMVAAIRAIAIATHCEDPALPPEPLNAMITP